MDVLVSAKTLETLVAAVGRMAAGEPLSGPDIAKARIAAIDAENRVAEAYIPEGVTPGRSLGMAPAGVAPLFVIDFTKGEWRDNCDGKAFAIQNIAAKHRPDILLDDVEPFQAAMYTTKGTYLARLSAELHRWGFDTLKTREKWAFYAPGAAGVQASAKAAFSNVPA